MERIGRSRKTKKKNEKIKSSLETLVWNVPGSCIWRKSNKKGEPSTNNVKMYMLGYNSIRSNKRKIALGCMQEISYPNRQKQSHFHVRNIKVWACNYKQKVLSNGQNTNENEKCTLYDYHKRCIKLSLLIG